MVKLPEERLGQVLRGKYRLDSIAGRGGLGVIFHAKHLKLGTPVALKFLQWQGDDEQEATTRMLAEARAASTLRHPNVVSILDIDESEDGFPFIVMEFLRGETLGALLHRGPLALDAAWALFRPIMDAVAHAHEHGIVHRDLKPDNIFLHRNHKELIVPKVVDFGAATLSSGSFLYAGTGQLAGTPHYMSPEQALGEDVDARADVWALGVMWIRALSGRFPFDFDERSNLLKVVTAVQGDSPALTASLVPGLPPTFSQTIDRALSVDKAVRFANARELLLAIGSALGREADWSLGEMALPSIPPPKPVSVRHYWPWVALSVVSVFLIAMFLFRPERGASAITLRGLPRHSAVFVDEGLVGRESNGALELERLAPRNHVVQVVLDGETVRTLRISVGPGEHREIDVSAEEE